MDDPDSPKRCALSQTPSASSSSLPSSSSSDTLSSISTTTTTSCDSCCTSRSSSRSSSPSICSMSTRSLSSQSSLSATGRSTPLSPLSVPGTSFSAERRRAARERLREALASVRRPAQKEGEAGTDMSRETGEDEDVEDETLRKRTSQLGRLSMIAAASGWDIKLRELVMKEANSSNSEEASEIKSPLRHQAEKRRSHSTSIGTHRRQNLEQEGDERPAARRSMSFSRSSMLFSPQCAYAEPDMEDVVNDDINSSQDTIAAEPDHDESKAIEDGENNGSIYNYVLDNSHKLYRRASEYSTIVTAYDERLREIVMEAAKPSLGDRTRRRKSIRSGGNPHLEHVDDWRDWKGNDGSVFPDQSCALSARETVGKQLSRWPNAMDLRRNSSPLAGRERRRTVSMGVGVGSRWSMPLADPGKDKMRTAPSTPVLKAPPGRRRAFAGRAVSVSFAESRITDQDAKPWTAKPWTAKAVDSDDGIDDRGKQTSSETLIGDDVSQVLETIPASPVDSSSPSLQYTKTDTYSEDTPDTTTLLLDSDRSMSLCAEPATYSSMDDINVDRSTVDALPLHEDPASKLPPERNDTLVDMQPDSITSTDPLHDTALTTAIQSLSLTQEPNSTETKLRDRDRDSAVDFGKDALVILPKEADAGHQPSLEDQPEENGEWVDLSDQLYIHFL
ncbi:uncharacterized protein SPPG_05134 [Spizellomyces punctatus DAOM BR117]|uniref:Uncharacterized protein n=1 Tax=Spizellomyces punctatus (strain DAOM BR117) TaxID=645134 RepID=A0A0L0HFF5_SPIPD|nr:uncharacterized protein SPPG_05134 [Spizellomyces punctatus DAOM BR117]KNC99756.1 hypothetical protein SPPG_05134 [Spizellomyces punctatus DAOM BR117]|eukprot:XP_016607796.1 hypothetical protein SPPG_05134 [Spizellomyces punctatus DAOM BR117]